MAFWVLCHPCTSNGKSVVATKIYWMYLFRDDPEPPRFPICDTCAEAMSNFAGKITGLNERPQWEKLS